MHCHNCVANITVPEGAKKIVLAGNPNVGKSVFFNALTGMYVDVSNFPGTTVEVTHGRFGRDVVIDTPGVYGVSSFNDEERVARDVILAADVIVNVVDAVHLERDLFLTLQVIDMGIPVVVVLNMMDDVKRHGMEIDLDLLSDLLGVPVIPAIAVQGKGIAELKASIPQARVGNTSPALRETLRCMVDRVGSQAEALMVCEDDQFVAARHGLAPAGMREEIYTERRRRVNDICAHVIKEVSKGASFATRLGRWMLRPLTGIPLLALTLTGMYYLIGVFVAQTVVGFTEKTVMRGMYEPAVRSFLSQYLDLGSVAGRLLAGEFGLLTTTVTYMFGLLLPLVLGFYCVLSLMEDSGYLPRIATLVDRVLNYLGLNGRAVVPLILGFGCVTMATITTRLLGSARERTIATVLLGLVIPCSAQLGVIAGLLAAMGAKYTLIYVGVIFAVMVIVGTLLNKLMPGESTELLIDLPPVRLPQLDNVVRKTATKSYMFIKEATPMFALGVLLISVMQITGVLVGIQDAVSPLTVGLLKLPKETATVFIMGIVRRDFGAAGLYNMTLTAPQMLVALVAITLFVPCIVSMMVMLKERGVKEGVLIWVSSWIAAFLVGGVVARLVM